MTPPSIFDLVDFVVFEMRQGEGVRAKNAPAEKMLSTLDPKYSAYEALFDCSGYDDLLLMSEQGRSFHSEVRLRNDGRMRLKWEIVRVDRADGLVMECVSANWDPVLDLVESFRTESLLFKELVLNIMPDHIAGELINTRAVRPRAYRDCTILFTDVVRFSKLTFYIEPVSLVRKLNEYFSIYDAIMDRYGLEKIKTIGDSYMCASGLPNRKDTHAVDAALAALDLNHRMNERSSPPRIVDGIDLNNWDIRVGMNSGPCISGVVGNKKYFFDIWGHAVNVAARMEEASEPGRINMSENTWIQVRDFFDCSFRGSHEIKHIGEIRMYFLERLAPEMTDDVFGVKPNSRFWDAYCERFELGSDSPNLELYPVGLREHLQRR